MNIRFYHARILQPADNHAFVLTEGELWVKGDTICYIGDGTDVSDVCGDGDVIVWEREIDVGGNVLMPGFKNAHTHTAMTFLRSFADDLPLHDWLYQKVFPKEAKLTQEDAYWLNILGIMEYLTSGITANADMYFLPLASARATYDTGFRTVQVSALNDFVSSPQQLAEEYDEVVRLGDRLRYAGGIHAEYTTSLSRMEGVARQVQKLQLPFFMHNSETKREVDECIARWGKTPTELTEELGMYEYGGGGYHCIWMSEHDMDIFKRRALTAVTNPASNLKLASGIAPVSDFLKRGIPAAIGTDGPASNNCLDMFREMFLVAGLAKVREMDAACVRAQEVLYMATTAGARAMGFLDCQALAVGQKADLIEIDMQQPNMQPENDFVTNLVYSGSKQNVKRTMVNGRILYEDGVFDIGFSPQEIYARANEIIGRMR